MSGVSQDGHAYFKGAADAIVLASGVNGQRPPDLDEHVERISREGGTPLALMLDSRIVGVVYLKDTVKPGMRQRFDEFRRMGIKTIMITGDNPLTAATIAQEAGVDDFVAQAKPEDKIRIIREQQAEGHLVAMTGDGTNDAPALAQADVGLAMNSGTAAAKEAANMVDLDSNPTKLIEVVAIGKQLLITRGAITTFSVANDVAKYFAIIPAAFVATYPRAECAQRHAARDAGERHPVGGHLQRVDHHRPGAAGAARRGLSAGAGRRAARPQPADLRRRRHHPAVHRHQDHRRHRLSAAAGMRSSSMTTVTTVARESLVQHLRTAVLMMVVLTVLLGIVYPLLMTGIAQVALPESGQRQPDPRQLRATWSARRCWPRTSPQPQYFHPRPSAAGSDGYDATARAARTWARPTRS